MSLGWYVRRLASMSPPEVAHRVVEQAKRAASRRRAYGWETFRVKSPATPLLPQLRQRLVDNASPALRDAIRASANDLLDGRFAALGVIWPTWDPTRPDPGVWCLDPVSGESWPGCERYCFDIEYRHEARLGDVKYVWEFNRLQMLQPLAAAVALHGDRRALAAVEAIVASWAENNPPYRGVGWNSGIELALRVVSLVVADALCGEALGIETRRRIRTLLSAHLYWLRRYPSRHSSANNHRIAELMGEFIVACMLPEHPEASVIGDAVRRELEREVLLQLLPDGVGAEQSPTYGAFTAEMVLVAGLVAAEGGRPFASAVTDRLARFAEFIAWISLPDGRTAAIGDDDEGRVISLCASPEEAYATSVANAINGFLGRPGLSPTRGRPELRDALCAVPELPSADPSGIRSFDEGGYTVVRERRNGRELHLILDHGPLGYLSIAAHGHADANAIWLALDGEPVLVDPGTYLYHSGGAWRDWFRGTRAHNTLSLDGQDQSIIAGPFNWSHKAKGWREDLLARTDWSITGRHDGYRRRFGVEHQRVVSADANGIVILDRLLPQPGTTPAALTFQAAPGIEIAAQDGEHHLRREGRTLLTIRIDAPGEIAVKQGEEGLDGGWVSPQFGTKVAASRLVWRGSVPPDGVRTTLRWEAD